MRMLAFILAISSSACMSSGVSVTEKQMKNLKIGVSTEKDVINTLGKPTGISYSKGHRMLEYSGLKTNANAGSFIPFVGLFSNTGSTSMSMVMFEIGKKGKVIDISRYDTKD